MLRILASRTLASALVALVVLVVLVVPVRAEAAPTPRRQARRRQRRQTRPRARPKLWTKNALPTSARYATFAVGDTHGDVRQTRRLLARAQLISRSGKWIGGRKRLVFLGDLVNKGTQSIEMLRFARAIETQARAAGGRVHVIMGNHEPLLVAAALALRALGPAEARRLASAQRALRPLLAEEPELLRALVFGGGTLAGARKEAPDFGYETLTTRQLTLLRRSIRPLEHAMRIMARHRSKSLWTCFIGNLGRVGDAQKLAKDAGLLAWVQRRPVMGKLAGDLLIHADAPQAYKKLGRTITRANRNARRLMQSKTGAFKLFDMLTDRDGLDSRKAVRSMLATYGGERLLHGHTPHDGPGPLVDSGGKRLNLDASLSDAFGKRRDRGVVVKARFPRR